MLAVVVAAIGVIAALGGSQFADDGSNEAQAAATGGGANLVLAIVAMAFGFAGLLIGSISMTMRSGSVPRGRVRLSILSIVGATFLGFGSGFIGFWVTSGLPTWPHHLGIIAAFASVTAVALALASLWLVWAPRFGIANLAVALSHVNGPKAKRFDAAILQTAQAIPQDHLTSRHRACK